MAFSTTSTRFDDTWLWDGTVWTQQAVTAPMARDSHGLAYDALRGVTVMFGGRSTGVIHGDTWELTPPPTLALAAVYGGACGAPPPVLSPHAASRPLLGQSQLSDVTNAPFGFAAVVWGITSQFLALDFVGATGCTLLNGAELEIGSFCQSTSISSARHSLAIPFDATLLGVHVYLQAWVMAPGYNPLGIAMSNGVELVIGDV